MSTIDEKTKLPLSLVIALVTAFVSIAGTAAVSHYRLSQLEKEWDQFKIEQTESTKVSQQQELKLQRLDLTLDNIKENLESINRKLDRMEKKDGR